MLECWFLLGKALPVVFLSLLPSSSLFLLEAGSLLCRSSFSFLLSIYNCTIVSRQQFIPFSPTYSFPQDTCSHSRWNLSRIRLIQFGHFGESLRDKNHNLAPKLTARYEGTLNHTTIFRSKTMRRGRLSQSPRISLHNAEGPETQTDHTIHITQTRMPQVQVQPVDLDTKMRKPVPTKKSRQLRTWEMRR